MVGMVMGSELERGHLQQALQQVGDAVLLGWFGVIAEQLATHHLGPQVRQLDA